MTSFLANYGTIFFRTTKFKRRLFFLLADVALITLSIYMAFWLRFDGKIPPDELENFRLAILPILGLTIFLLAAFGLYNFTWRFFGLRDLLRLLAALTSASLVLAILIYFINPFAAFQGFPRSVLLVNYLLTVGWLGSLRILKRAWRVFQRRIGKSGRDKIRTLIVGAGAAGEQICKEMMNNEKSRYTPVGFVDDDPAKQGLSINGVKVIGTTKNLPGILTANGIDEILVAMPSATSSEIRRVVELVRTAEGGRKIRVLPSLLGLVDGNVTLSDIKEIQVEDVLGRDPVKIDFQEIRKMIEGRRVLVTGAGGSIGSELARTVLQFGPAKLIFLDIDETELFHLVQRFKDSAIETVPVIGDVRDRGKMSAVFKAHRPEIVIHAAAYKHVPIMEHYPEEAVKTNVKGTMILAEEAIKSGARIFVNISTDKAINPASIMGATKRTAEEILRIMNRRNGVKFISVRFGNVLGSRGSVVPLFKEQIRTGGPVTVTHPEMKRYFMAISEAVLLVLEAAAGGKGGETFVLDMGEPVKIVDLAREMIVLSGKRPDVDIPIIFIGLRGGEKLFEEILGTKEETERTKYEKIYRTKNTAIGDEAEMLAKITRLIECAENGGGKEGLRDMLKAVIPTYTPDVKGSSISFW